MYFPEEVDGNRNNSPKWKKTDVIASSNTVIGDIYSETDKFMVKTMIHNKAFTCWPIYLKTAAKLKKKARTYKCWGNSQCLGYYFCSHPMCNATFQVRRIDGWFALYLCENHYHPDIVQSKGLPRTLKTFASTFVGRKNAAKLVLASIAVFPEEVSTTILGPLKMADFHGESKQKRQLVNFLYESKKSHKAQILRLQDGQVSKIGRSQSHLAKWLDDRLMTLERACNLSDNECLLDRDIIVLSHDLHLGTDGRWTHVTFLAKQVIPILREAVLQTVTRKHGLMAEIDYTCSVEVDNLMQLGTVGISDCDKRFIQVIFDINQTENSKGTTRILHMFREMVTKMGGHCDKVLKDAAVSLSKAARNVGLVEADCLTHKCRLKSWGGGRPSGTRGSLETYLMKIGATNDEIKSLTAIMLAIATLPTSDEWSFAVSLVELYLYKEDFSFISNDRGMKHLKECYFPAICRYGPLHSAMEAHSTNGLEKGWDHSKQGISIFKDLLNCGGVEAIFNFVSNKSAITMVSTSYNWRPQHKMLDWDRVRGYHVCLPGRFRHITIYRDGLYETTERFLNNCNLSEAGMLTEKVVIYVPSSASIGSMYHAALDAEFFEVKESANKFYHDAMIGSLKNGQVLRHVHEQVSKLLMNERPSQVEGDDIVTYLMRRGQRISHYPVRAYKLKRSTSAKVVMQEQNEYEKWSGSMNEIESVQKKRKTPLGIGVENVGKKIPALCVKTLGTFCRVVIAKDSYNEMVDSTNDGYGLTCSCANFRRNGTCDESKLFGWMFLKRFPPKSCLPHVFQGMEVEWRTLLEEYRRSMAELGLNEQAFTTPSLDPWMH